MKLVNSLLDSIVTKQEGEEIIRFLEDMEAGRKVKPPLGIVKFAKTIDPEDKELAEIFKKNFYRRKTVRLELAFLPKKNFLKKVSGWFSENLGEPVILDVVYDPKLVGGVKLICNDHFRDFSLASKIESAFKF